MALRFIQQLHLLQCFGFRHIALSYVLQTLAQGGKVLGMAAIEAQGQTGVQASGSYFGEGLGVHRLQPRFVVGGPRRGLM